MKSEELLATQPPGHLERIAYHEAGHVVASHILGLGFTDVSVGADPETDSLGRIGYADEEQEHESIRLRPWTASDFETVMQVQNRIMRNLAGFAAESLFSNHDALKKESRDYHDALDEAELLSMTDDEAEAFLAWLYLRIKKFLGTWPNDVMLLELAQQLLQQKQIGEEKAKEIMKIARHNAIYEHSR